MTLQAAIVCNLRFANWTFLIKTARNWAESAPKAPPGNNCVQNTEARIAPIIAVMARLGHEATEPLHEKGAPGAPGAPLCAVREGYSSISSATRSTSSPKVFIFITS